MMKPAVSETPAPPTQRAAAWFTAALEVQLARFPLLIQARAYWRLLLTQRRDWPWLLPLLALIALRSYRRERRRIQARHR